MDDSCNSDSPSAAENVAPSSSSDVRLLFGLLPLSCLLVQIPFVNIFAPLIGWLSVKKDHSASRPAFISVLNMQISWSIYGITAGILFLVFFLMVLVGGMGVAFKSFGDVAIKNIEVSVGIDDHAGRPCKKDNESEKGDSCENRKLWESIRKDSPASSSSEVGESSKIVITGGGVELFKLEDFPSGLLGPVVAQVLIVCGALLLGAGWLLWVGMTIFFAIKVKNDVNAKAPLTIRFFR